MLIRVFRLTDKLTNALLRALIWLFESLARQLYELRLALTSFFVAALFTAVQTLRSGRIVYAQSAERRREYMARRAVEQSTRTIVREDPLKTQNRALSLFTVVLLAALIGLVLWASSAAQPGAQPVTPREVGVSLPLTPTQPTPTPIPPTPTPTPTPTPIPDPLRVSGSVVFSMRENGRENLWAIGIGQTAQPIRLTNTPVDDRDPVWSPDGSRIAFASRRDGNWDLYVLEVATGQITRLTYSLAYEAAPTWSPDGQFIAYEAYDESNTNLDVYIIQANGQGQPQRLTYNPAPDYAPAWNPGGAPVPGRQIAYVSLRDGNAELYVISLDNPLEELALRLTNTPDIDEQSPAWSPDGRTLAYNALTGGTEFVFTKPADDPNAEPLTIGQGRGPTWAPNGLSLLFALDSGSRTTLVGGLADGAGSTATAITVAGRARHPHWIGEALPESLIQSGGVRGGEAVTLYTESIAPPQSSPPFYQFRVLSGVIAPLAVLSDRVDDSFNALRQAVLRQVGYDFLGQLADASWSLERLPEPGQSRQSWHYAGRAFAFDRNLVFNQPIPPIEVVREDIGVNTLWRVYLRVEESQQGGQLGEPLKRLSWDFASRGAGDPQIFEQGGRTKAAVPPGYYVDFTQLAEDYGWTRVPAGRDWRGNFASILYWQFTRRDGLNWNEAMLELYTQPQIDALLFGPTPVPTNTPPPVETDIPGRRTPTPLPPDLGGS